jgi:hypothetical protein
VSSNEEGEQRFHCGVLCYPRNAREPSIGVGKLSDHWGGADAPTLRST